MEVIPTSFTEADGFGIRFHGVYTRRIQITDTDQSRLSSQNWIPPPFLQNFSARTKLSSACYSFRRLNFDYRRWNGIGTVTFLSPSNERTKKVREKEWERSKIGQYWDRKKREKASVSQSETEIFNEIFCLSDFSVTGYVRL